MKKNKFKLKTVTDIKVFILFLLEYIRHPVERVTLLDIIYDNTDEIAINYDECINELLASSHIVTDDTLDEVYYAITESGRMVASELFDTLDQDFRENALKIATKHLSLLRRGAKISTTIEKTEGVRYKVTLKMRDKAGEIFEAAITTASLSEAEKIREHFERSPESVYRGIFFSVTGRYEYLS